MEEIKEFSPEVCREIGYYVYRLVDPRNGQTFYVGKGKNNRVFAHAKCALKDYADVDYNPEEDDDESLKYRTIRKIKDAGLEVIYIIERYHLSERDAFLIESVLIDTYSIKRELTNKIKGYESTESVNALTLETLFNISEYEDSPDNPQYVIIKVKDYWLIDGEVIKATIEIGNSSYVQFVIDWFGRNARTYKKDGKLYADIKCNESALFYWYMQYSECVTIISPQSLIDIVKAEAERIVKKYE